MPRRAASALLLLLLGASLAVNTIGIGFGMPRHYDPSIDAVHPVLALDAIRNVFGARSALTLKYPRNHFLVLGAVERAWLWARHGVTEGERLDDELLATLDRYESDWLRLRDELKPEAPVISELIVVGRIVSAIADTLIILALFLFARALFGVTAALIAASFATLSYPFVYYAHTLNVDTVVTCFGMFALHEGVRAVQLGSLRRLFTCALFMTLAVGTKDYFYAWFLLPAPLLLWLYARPGSLAPATPRRPLPFVGVLVVTALAIFAYLVMQGLPFDVEGFRKHTKFLFSPGVDSFQQVDPHRWIGTPDHPGQWYLLCHVAGLIATALGPVLLFTTFAGAVLLVRRAPRAALLVFVPVVSFYVTFLAPIGFAFVRFLFPVLLACFVAAAYACAALLEDRRTRAAGAVLVAVILGHAAWRTATLLDLLRHDPINAASSWLEQNVPDGARVIAWFDAPTQTIELPARARVHLFKNRSEAPPPEFSAPDFLIVSQYEGPLGPKNPDPVAVDMPPVLNQFGSHLVRVATFGPDRPHPIRWQAAFLPQVFVYRNQK